MPTRRAIIRLSLGVPLFFTACATEREHTPMVDGRFHARPRRRSGVRTDEAVGGLKATAPRDASNAATTPKPEPLRLGTARDGFFYIPARKDSSRPAPLLLYLHGAGGSGAVIQYLLDHADSLGTVLVAPDSRGKTWGLISGDEGVDVEFIDAALQKVFDRCPIDPGRIGIGGFSDGATAALSWGLVNGDLFSDVIAFSPGGVRLPSPPVGKPRVFISHGLHDRILPIDRCSRRIVPELRSAGYAVDYREFDGDHEVPGDIGDAGLGSLLK